MTTAEILSEAQMELENQKDKREHCTTTNAADFSKEIRRTATGKAELRPFTITSTVKLEATDTRAAILKASQLLAEVANGTPYEFEELSVKVE